jgi:predicted nuclease of predicted toxin-antitoxin system
VARFYSNENIALPVVTELRRLGHDVLTSFDAERANSAVPDPEVLAFAASEERILLSHNRRDFLRLHRRRTSPHGDMVLCTVDVDFLSLALRIHDAVTAKGDIQDAVIRVNQPAAKG